MKDLERYSMSSWLPTSSKEVEALGWDQPDVIMFSGDAYVDHPSFGSAVIGRIMEREGLHVAIVPQPNWQDDLRDFKKLGKPKLFFAISGGCMDSMVNHYTANKRRRSNDAYTPGNRAGARPDYATTVYSNILKTLYPEIPVVIGGIEASLRRLTHYDYWSDTLKPGILADSNADLLVYGMGEKSVISLIGQLKKGTPFKDITSLHQTAFLRKIADKYSSSDEWEELTLNSHEICLTDKVSYAANFRHIEEESNKIEGRKLTQTIKDNIIVVNPPWPLLTTEELDSFYDLPFTRLPHPRYRNKGTIPSYEMIRHSVNIHRGCFGGCAFCTISAHQGKFISSRSEGSILSEIEKVTQMDDFKGYISDIGGPSANMYQMTGRNLEICRLCHRPSCIFPAVCNNLNTDHRPMSALYKKVAAMPGVKKVFIGSGIRYDLIFHKTKDAILNTGNIKYLEEVILKHVSGRLKVAPEHTSDKVLKIMRKHPFSLFLKLKSFFDQVNEKNELKQQLIPYFISSHPGSGTTEMADLAAETKGLDFRLEQVQDFTPTPMTLATEIYYSGLHPYTLEKIYTAKTAAQKLAQRKFFFWYQKEYRNELVAELRKINRPDLEKKLFGKR